MSSDNDQQPPEKSGPWGRPEDKPENKGDKKSEEHRAGKPSSPWHSAGQGGPNAGPPDVEEWIRRSQDRFKKAVPGGRGPGAGGGHGGGSGWDLFGAGGGQIKHVVLAGIGILALWLSSGFYRVEPDQKAVVLRFGKLVRTEEPGLRYHFPSPIERVVLPRVTSENLIQVGFKGEPSSATVRRGGADPRDVPEESIMLTGDENIINIDFVVKWRIDNAANFLFKIREPEQTIKRAAESAMREVIARTNIQPALTEARERIQEQTRTILQNMLNEYEAGVLVTGVELLNVQVPTQVVDAFDDVQRAAQDRQRLRNEAETYRNRIIPEARGQAERMSQEAQAYREEVVNRAKGDTDRFIKVYESYKNARDVTTQRIYLETLEDILKNANKVIVEDGGKNGVVPYLPLDRLNPVAAPPLKRGEK